MTPSLSAYPSDRPAWLTAFDQAPSHAVDQLLRGRALPDRLVRVTPSELVRDWLVAWGDEDDFAARLDSAFAQWVRTTWHEVPATSSDARRLARAWLNLFLLVGTFDFFTDASTELLDRASERETYLWPLSTGPALDPVGRFLAAIAPYQPDRRLARSWWTMCDLPPDVPYYHIAYAVAGIRGLPPQDVDDQGGFRWDVAHAVRRIGRGLARSVEDGRVTESVAREEFTSVATITIDSFPFPGRWREALCMDIETAPANVREWLAAVTPKASRTRGRADEGSDYRRRSSPRFDTSWPSKATTIAAGLRQREPSSRQQADALLREQHIYALQTGDTDAVARSLCNFARSIWDHDAATAAEWATGARRVQPWDPYTWNTLARSLLRAGRRDDSVRVGWQAIERFPDNEVTWNDLGAALVEAYRFLEAEEVFWQSAERFPHRPYGWRGVGDVLRRQGEFSRAEAVYRRALSEFCPDNAFLLDGLGNVLKAVGEYEAAIGQYRQALHIDPHSAYSWRGLAMAEKAAGHLDLAEKAFRDGLSACPSEEYLARGLKALLRVRADLGGAARASREPAASDVEASTPPPVLHEDAVESLSPQQIEAQLSTARTLRRAARRRREDLVDGIEAASHANQLLAALRSGRPWETRPLVEAIIGAAESGDVSSTKALLADGARRFPQALQLAYAETRAWRELAARSGGSDPDIQVDEIIAPLRRFRRFDMALRPVELLETFRAQLVVPDTSQEARILSLSRLRRLIDEPAARPFEKWWKDRMHAYVLGSNGAGTVEAADAHLRRYGRQLDALEEDISNRVAIPSG